MSSKQFHVTGCAAALCICALLVFFQVKAAETEGYGAENLDTGLSYNSIQQAIDAAETLDGHTILVREGRYVENIVVHKSVSLRGENRRTVIIDGSLGNAVNVTADNVSISHFTISGGIMFGVYINENVSFCNVSYNDITHNSFGIMLNQSFYSVLSFNNIIGNYCAGIWLYQSIGNHVYANTIESAGQSDAIGIVQFSEDNTIEANNITNNMRDLNIHTSTDNYIYHKNFVNNTQHVLTIGSQSKWDNGYPSGGNY
ncbi:right-handed parallel beta-helix repeat-containing protein [Candidatus Bathyarchaeota archaeon]|nr:right-handed parallel beta-helix repeat-containing protein [Candidatus Bathyarchaeota archaeon]